MEPGPALAWLLLLSLLADCLKAAQSRDFTVKDIIYLHPSTTPYPGGFKCFTCEKAADNYECNRWAPDIYCPRGDTMLLRPLEGRNAVPSRGRRQKGEGREQTPSLKPFSKGPNPIHEGSTLMT
ncbi:ly6/PLAUR domain-containing protein 6 isoform X2 [Saimiri boliviensis]|uniref:ly6/PLAUR domain-containing protein 6 isoform X2 n=1 Tax=Saimiri boliviensis TaxID=27679 RepID=UPI003D76B2CF